MKEQTDKMSELIRIKAAFPGNKNQRGAVLILSLLVSVVLLTLSVVYVSMSVAEQRMTSRYYSSTAAISLAEAGVERAIWELNYGGRDFLVNEGWSGTGSKTLSDTLQAAGVGTIGGYTVTVTNPTGPNPEIEATGYVPNQSSAEGQRTVKVTLVGGADPLFSLAVFGADGICLDASTLIDSYDSRKGLYNDFLLDEMDYNIGDNGDIRTDSVAAGGIVVDGTVNGDATVGPEGNTITVITGSGPISGTKSAAASAYNPPSVSPPAGLATRSDITMGKGSSTTISSSGQYANINLGKESTITINSDVTLYITTSFHLDKDSQVSIINNAKVEIYLNGSLTFDQWSQINNVGKDPSKLTLYGTDNFVDPVLPSLNPQVALKFDQNTEFYGSIYTPKASVSFAQGGQIYGAVVAKRIQLDNSSKIHFDEALLYTGPGGAGSSAYALTCWQEK